VNLGHGLQEIKIIADPGIDPNFGTGVVGVTPAHSFIDAEIAQKNNLPSLKVIGEDGRMTASAGKDYEGLTVLEAREKFINWLRENNLLEKEEEVSQNLSICYRCGTSIEPLPSKQWFISVNKKFKIQNSKLKGIKRGKFVSLKEIAKKVVKSGEIKIIPDRFKKIYFHWIENLRDWCISRQIWFGHRIPVWYKSYSSPDKLDKEQEIYVGINPPLNKDWKQDPDTLDTWFSSALWTFSTLLDKNFRKYKNFDEWIRNSLDLKQFHPTSLMETGYDILFFWVARMILMTTYTLGEIPFHKVYLHGLVRDEEGRKMSKSLGNVINPLDMITKYGTDALRLSLVIGATPGNDLKLSEEKIAGFRNFTNKLWNIGRYILTAVKEIKNLREKPKPKTLADQWILTRLNEIISEVSKHLDNYEFSAAGEKLRDFTWGDFADWYIEIHKIEKNDSLLVTCYLLLLKLWHPFMPFVTEVIWGMMAGSEKKEDLLIVQRWPEEKSKIKNKKSKIIEDFNLIQKIVVAVRNLRAEKKIEPARKIKAIIYGGKKTKLVKEQAEIIKRLSGIGELEIGKKGKKPEKAIGTVVEKIEIYLPLTGLVDVRKERERVKKEIELIKQYIEGIEKKLANKEFVDKAPEAVVENERVKLESQKERLKKLEQQLKSL